MKELFNMKKIIILIILIIFIVIISIIGYFSISAKESVQLAEDPLESQATLEKEINAYGFSLDNPNVIVNPYNNSPLTAIIAFTTEETSEVKVTILDQNNNPNLTHTYEENTIHYLPIYGLYSNYENKVVIETKEGQKTLTLTTDEIPPIEVSSGITPNDGEFVFVSTDNYLYAYDQTQSIRWYLPNYTGNITLLDNNHLILGSNRPIDEFSRTSVVEIDLLGKIYYEYTLEDGYSGLSTLKDNNILALSGNNILEVDRQNGNIVNKYPVESDNWQHLSYHNQIITISNTETSLNINTENNEKSTVAVENVKDDHIKNINIYQNAHFRQVKSVRFGQNKETPTSKKSIAILNYQDLDDKFNLQLIQEHDRLVVSGEFEEETYLILDKFLGKRIYEITNTPYYINSNGLSGKYSIYIKSGDHLYKTNKYVNF